MGIKQKNIDPSSHLARHYLGLQFNNTAGYSLSAGYSTDVIVPVNSDLEEVWFTNDVDITASNGIVMAICNATTDVVPLAAAGNGLFWSCSRIVTNHTGSVDFVANTFLKITPTATYVSAGCLLHVTVSATIGTSPFGVTLVLRPESGVK